jgi:flagellar hook-associated protein 2
MNEEVAMSSASTLSVGGLASGVDTNSIIDQLVSLEQQKVTKIQKRQTTAETTLSALGKLKSQLATFRDKANALSTVNGFSIYKSDSSDPDTADIQTGNDGKGVEGNFAVDVKQLASSLKVASKSFGDATAALGLSGTLRLSTSAAHQASSTGKAGSAYVDIGINSSDALTDIAARINAATGGGATATVLNVSSGDSRLVLTGVDTGASGFTLSDPDTTDGSDLARTLGFTGGATRSESDFSFRLSAGGAAPISSPEWDIPSPWATPSPTSTRPTPSVPTIPLATYCEGWPPISGLPNRASAWTTPAASWSPAASTSRPWPSS